MANLDNATAARILNEWNAAYAEHGTETPLPTDFIEDNYGVDVYESFLDLMDDAAIAHATEFVAAHPELGYDSAEDYIDNMQGYHDEWAPVIAAALKIVS